MICLKVVQSFLKIGQKCEETFELSKKLLTSDSVLTHYDPKLPIYVTCVSSSLAIVFALKKFHKYLYGRKFILLTDHQPLQFIFGKNKGIPTSAAARITRWAVTLSGYQYDIQYKKGTSISNADGLFRLPCKKFLIFCIHSIWQIRFR